MNTSSFSSIPTRGVAVVLLALAGAGAFAAEPAPAELTRQQVRAEFVRAHAAGELASPADVYAPVRQAMAESQRSVRALAAAREVAPAASTLQRLGSAAR